MKCAAKRSNGQPCNAPAVGGRSVCRVHGGASVPAGPSHHRWKHGRNSKYIPARLAEKYEEALADPHLTEYRQDIALLESRLLELLATGESLPLWDKTQDAFRDMRDAMARRDAVATQSALASLENLINRGMADALRWAEVYRITEQIGKTKEREHKRMVQAQQMISAEQLLAMMGRIADAARRTITNQDELRAFAATLNAFGLVESSQPDNGGH